MKNILLTFTVFAIVNFDLFGQNSKEKFHLVTDNVIASDRSSTGGVSFVDSDNDGDLDLYITNGYDVSGSDGYKNQLNRFYINTGNGAYELLANTILNQDSTTSSGSTWADYDNDGDLDVFVSNQRRQNNILYRNDGNNRFTRVDGIVSSDRGRSFAASWVDVDSDGWLDIYVSNGGLDQKAPDFLYRNVAGRKFEKITEGEIVSDSLSSIGGLWRDFDNDGDPDLYVPDKAGSEVIYINEGSWKFTKKSFPGSRESKIYQRSSACACDFDNDGDLDIYQNINYGGANILYLNDGQGNFKLKENDPSVLMSNNGYAASCADYDNDGDEDLIIVNWGSANQYFTNDGTGKFSFQQNAISGTLSYASSIATGDFDEDGDLDLVIGQWPNFPGQYESNQLFRNEIRKLNWIKIKLAGTESNKSAIGARIIVTTSDGRKQLREVNSHSSWRSQSDLTQHFGLNKSKKIESIEVKWPSGKKTTIKNETSNQLLTITEE